METYFNWLIMKDLIGLGIMLIGLLIGIGMMIYGYFDDKRKK